MADAVITESVDVYSADPKRVGKYDRWITYTVDGIRTNMIIIPAETATQSSIKAEIIKREEERAKLVGQKFTI